MGEIIAEAWDAFVYSKEGEAILCAFQAHFSGLLPCIYTENILHRRFAVQIRGEIMPSALRLWADQLQMDSSGLCWKKIHSKLFKEMERSPSMRKSQNWAAFAFVVVKIDSIQIPANENVHL